MIIGTSLDDIAIAIYSDSYIHKGWNWLSITDPDDPLTQIVIQVRPNPDQDVAWFN